MKFNSAVDLNNYFATDNGSITSTNNSTDDIMLKNVGPYGPSLIK